MNKTIKTPLNTNSPKDIIIAHGLKPKKSFGQNFMIDDRVNLIFADTVKSIDHTSTMPVIEIGAGTGALTRQLLKLDAYIVHAVERDRDLVPILASEFAPEISTGKLRLHEADGARLDFSGLCSAEHRGILVGNLPYHLTSSILILALNQRKCLQAAIFLVQKEVADRLLAGPNSKDYGFLTAVLKLAFKIEIIAQVDKSAFWPVPKINSTIIKLETFDAGISQVPDIQEFLLFVREIFQQRRKKLSTILKGRISSEQWAKLAISPDLRPENLEPRQFLDLFLQHQGAKSRD